MVTGAECSAGSNPLAQFMKVTEDQSALKEKFTPALQQGGPSPFRTARLVQDTPDQFANEFLNRQQEYGSFPMVGPAEADVLGRPPDIRGWAAEFSNQVNHPLGWELNPYQTQDLDAAFKRMTMQSTWEAEYLQSQPRSTTRDSETPHEFEATFQKHKNHDWASEFSKQDKGKAKIVELDEASWEQQFAAAQREAEEGQQNQVIDAALSNEENKMFEKAWSRSQEKINNVDSESLIWECGFTEFNQNEGSLTNHGEYVFETNNPYLDHSSPLQEGIRLVEEGGSLSEAALALEAAVKRNENSSEAWTWLGNTQAQNEKEEPAIRALEKAISIDGSNLDALMSLAVSYTNESFDQQSYITLERWITAKYPEIVSSAAPMDGVLDTHSRVTDLFLRTARNVPEGQEMDADVQVGLGVLFYGSSNYEKAVDCFVSALKSRPKDYLLWNRLGATLANSGRSEDAIEAYHKALEYKPTFVRARYNLGVSCINIGCLREAAEHLLGALSMHQTSHDGSRGINVSNSLRDTLRRTFLMMERRDLAEKVESGVDVNQFRDEFEF
ncbi:hypothetical protein G9A89_017085 [Geosiphon pyriformis]|nr:hypothetical protein G9A89_017085 [Geosiphon pyriformis]